MEIRVLQYFVAVAKEESITRAADTLHITQPTLSRQLTALEEELGVKLFERGRHFTLTAEGELLYRRAEQLLALAEITVRELKEQKGRLSGKMRLALSETTGAREIIRALKEFQKENPGVTVQIRYASPGEAKRLLDSDEAELAVIPEPVELLRYQVRRLHATEKWGLLMRSDDPLAGRNGIDHNQLRELPLLMPEKSDMMHEVVKWLGGEIRSLHIKGNYNLISCAGYMMEDGKTYALALEGSCEFLDSSRFSFVPLRPELRIETALAWKKYQSCDRVSEHFLSFLERLSCK